MSIYRPVSAYALFFRDTQAAIKGSNPNASFGEVSKIVASMWDNLDAEQKAVSVLIFVLGSVEFFRGQVINVLGGMLGTFKSILFFLHHTSQIIIG